MIKASVKSDREVRAVMYIVSHALGKGISDYYSGRHGDIVEMRTATIQLVIDKYPNTTVERIGHCLGIHHTSVTYHRQRATRLMKLKDTKFLTVYNIAKEALQNL